MIETFFFYGGNSHWWGEPEETPIKEKIQVKEEPFKSFFEKETPIRKYLFYLALIVLLIIFLLFVLPALFQSPAQRIHYP